MARYMDDEGVEPSTSRTSSERSTAELVVLRCAFLALECLALILSAIMMLLRLMLVWLAQQASAPSTLGSLALEIHILQAGLEPAIIRV